MKVITQLIKHFWQRGVLTIDEAHYLVAHGFIRPRDLAGYDPLPETPEEDLAALLVDRLSVEPPTRLEQLEESLIRRTGRRRKSGEPKREPLTAEQVCERLRGEYERRESDLRVLVRLAQLFQPCDDWMEAASFLHDIGYSDFTAALDRAWTKRYVTLRDVWQALEMEPLHQLITDDDLRGRAARAYSALLIVHEPAALGKYAWILKHDEVQAVSNLRVLERRLRGHLKQLYHGDPQLLARAVEDGCDRTAFWALVLLHNAHRQGGVPESPAPPAEPEFGCEYGPLTLPDESIWKQAWTGALGMDRAAVTRLLCACYRHEKLGRRTPDLSTWPLYCPCEWREPSAAMSAL